MESTTTLLTPPIELCEDKAAKVMRWISESEDISKTEFTVARLFETGVLQDNTKAFLHLILEEQFPGERIALELPPEEIHKILSDAFTKTYRYLLTPHTFLSDFLTFGNDSVTIGEKMLARLSYLVDYQYFTDMLDEWFAIWLQSGNPNIPKSELSKFISDVDRSIIRYSTLTEISTFLLPLFEFEGLQSVSHETMQIFLADKSLSFPPDGELVTYSSDDAALLLKEALINSELVQPVEEFAPIPEYDSFLKELRDVGVMLPPPHRITEKIEIEEEKINLPPIQMFISLKLRKKCLEKIFHENIHEYDRAISMLNSIEDYSQAELNLQTLLQIHKISQDSKTAHRLEAALQLRFGISSTIISD